MAMTANTSIMDTTPPIQIRVTSSSATVILPALLLKQPGDENSDNDENDDQRQAREKDVDKHGILPSARSASIQETGLSGPYQVAGYQYANGHKDCNKGVWRTRHAEPCRKVAEGPH